MGFMYNIIMKTQFPPKLVEAVHYLNQIQIVLCTLNTDGRRNSQDDEDINADIEYDDASLDGVEIEYTTQT